MASMPHLRRLALLTGLAYLLPLAAAASAQSIRATGQTEVQHTGDDYTITGGMVSADSQTLFHQFQQFGLLGGETARFTNSTDAAAIVGRVSGGQLSIINGLLSVEGAADLYLLNPTGLLLGPDASLDLSGSFSASTATGLSFGNGDWDAALGHDVGLLEGTPTGYLFSADPGSLVNQANLSVAPGQSLTLLGGDVVNTGSLTAAAGQVLVASVSGSQRIRLGQPGSLLSLELDPWSGGAATLSGATLPALLTGAASAGIATTIETDATGALRLSGSDLSIPTDGATTAVGGAISGGEIAVLGERVALDGATVNAAAPDGGEVFIGGGVLGGDLPRAAVTVIDEDTSVTAAGGGGTVVTWGTDLLSMAGTLSAPGGLVETSSLGLLDIVTAPQATAGGLWLIDPPNVRIVAGGGSDIGTTNPFDASGVVTGEALLGVDLITAALTGGADVEVRTTGPNPGDGTISLETPLDFNGTGGNTLSLISEGDIQIQQSIFDSNTNDTDALNLNLLASQDITATALIDTNGGSFFAFSDAGQVSVGEVNTAPFPFIANNNGTLTILAETGITTGLLSTRGRDLVLDTNQGNITVNERLFTSSTQAIEPTPGGDVTISAPNGSVSLASIVQASSTVAADGGDISISGGGPVNIGGELITTASDGFSPGDISVISGDTIAMGGIRATNGGTTGGGSSIALNATGDIVFGSIEATSPGTLSDTLVSIFSANGFVRGEGVFVQNDANAATVDIFHAGGLTVPFSTGDAAVNGTQNPVAVFSTGGGRSLANDFLGTRIFGTPPDDPNGVIQLRTTDQFVLLPPTVPDIDRTTVIPPDLPLILPVLPVDPLLPPNLPIDPFNPGGPVGPSNPVGPTLPSGEPVLSDTKLATALNPQIDNAVAVSGPPVGLSGQVNQNLSPQLRLSQFESAATAEFSDHLGLGEDSVNGTADLPMAQASLLQVQNRTGKKPAIVYAVFGSSGATPTDDDILNVTTEADPLELLLVTAEGDPIYVPLEITRAEVVTMAQRLRRQVSTPSRADLKSDAYLESAQYLYQWLIAPLAAELAAQEIDTISFVTDAGLRSLPLAALHDGEGFLIEKYNVGLMPSLSLTDLTYQDITNVSALVTGTSAFVDQAALPGVPVELDSIASHWKSNLLRGEEFVLDNLRDQRQQNRYGIVHLATHGQFNPGKLSNSHLYLHNEKLALDRLRTLELHNPAVELITLSACQTALGSRSAELGFAGFAVLAGAKTAVASLWNVSDEASAGLMIEFYRQLGKPSIKAEALRLAQLAMLRGDITVEGDQLQGVDQAWPLPVELAADGAQDFSHPYYWAAFTLVGSPW